MIHFVRMPAQDRAMLLEIVELQQIILALATARTTAFSDDGSEIKAHFETMAEYKDHASDIAKWITGKKTTLFAYLNEYAAYSNIAEKQALQQKIQDDLELLLNPTDRTFQVSFRAVKLKSKDKEADEDKKDRWLCAVGGFLYQFYDEWEQPGFQNYLFKARMQVNKKYTRADFIRHFVAENTHLYICPICDASSYRNETSSGTYTSIDHFFPRAQYPHLSIHPLNLLPMCPACNSGEAGQRDPQEGLDGITDLILPYQGGANSLAGRTYVKIGFRSQAKDTPKPDDEDGLTHALTFSLEIAANQEAELLATQIVNFEKVYGVQKRWNKGNNLTLIDEHVFRRIRQFLLSDIERGEPLHDPQFLLERLELLMVMIDKQSLGQDPFSYMMTWWLMYHIHRLEKQKEKIAKISQDSIDCATYKMSEEIEPIFVELYCWAQEQQNAFAELKSQVKRLRARMTRDG